MHPITLGARNEEKERYPRIYGYVNRFEPGYNRIVTAEPDFSTLPVLAHDWTGSEYGNVTEEIPKDAPKPLGKPVVTYTYVDANLWHDFITGRALTAILHFINGTYFDWYTRRQATVETLTFGSEFVASRTAVEQIMDNRLMLRYLGVPLKGATHLFGDNQSVVVNATVPHSQLKKRHVALLYHRVREAIVSKTITFHHVPGDRNYSDWGHTQVWDLVKEPLFLGDAGNKMGNQKRQDESTTSSEPTSSDFGELQDPGKKGHNRDHDVGNSSGAFTDVFSDSFGNDISDTKATPIDVKKITTNRTQTTCMGAWVAKAKIGGNPFGIHLAIR